MIELQNYKVAVREDLSHYSPIGVDWYYGFRKLGCKVDLLVDQASLLNYTTDLDLFVNMMDISDPDVSAYLVRLKRDNPECTVLSTVARPFEKQEDYFDYVDYWFDCGYEHPIYQEWYESRGQKFISVLEGTNPDLFFKGIVDQSYIRDFSFIGQFGGRGHGYRGEDRYLYPLIDDTALTHYLFGFSYGNVPMQHINYSEVNSVFNCTKINLNFHYPEQKSIKTVINKRAFDIAASGNFQLIDHPKFEELTGIKAYPDPKDYIEAFYYYLDKPEERLTVAEKAQEVILRDHTWEVRMKNLINELYSL